MKTFGFELEWSNIDKNKSIPEELGFWEGKGQHSEVDLINYIDDIYLAAWPDRRWGGEINTMPTKSIDEQIDNIVKIHQIFKDDNVMTTPISNGHVHVRDDRFDDVEVLKDIYQFVINNQDEIISYWLSLDELREYKNKPTYHKHAYRYLRNDGGKRLSDKFEEDVFASKTLDEFYEAIVPHSKKTGRVLWARAGRPGINLHSLRHTGTIEFRCMKATTDFSYMYDQLRFVNHFIDRAIDGGSDFKPSCLNAYRKPPLNAFGCLDDVKFLDGLNDWWDTREERKKAGEKKRVGFIKI